MKNQLVRLHPDMGPGVLNHLSHLFEEFNPQEVFSSVAGETAGEVFIAGQSVASALSQLYGTRTGVVYNDIDAFVMSDELESGPNVKRRRGRLATLEYEVAEIDLGPYGGLMVTPMSVYAVHSTKRVGMLNTVLSRPRVPFRGPLKDWRAQQFLRSFDLNCVQVGVRLSDQKLVWTRDFSEFLATRQILVANPKTPVHTAIRYLRKKQELEGVYGNDEQTMELLTAAQQRVRLMVRDVPMSKRLRRQAEAQLSMATMYAQKARNLGPELSKWFDLETVDQAKVQLFTLQPTSSPDSRLLSQDVPELLLPTYARALRGHWRKHVCANIVETVENIHPTRYPHMAVYAGGAAAVATQQGQRGTRSVDKALKEHSGIAPWLRYAPVEAHAALVKAMRGAEKRHGLWAFGVFETQKPDDATVYRLRNEPEAVEGIVSQWFEGTLERLRQEERSDASKYRPVITPVEYAGYRFEPLWTFQALAEEGVRLCHCVAGYLRAIREGETHIISMRKHRAKDSLTVQLTTGHGGFHVAQARGLQNRPANDAEMAIAKRLAAAATVYAALAKFGYRLSSNQFAAVLGNDALLRKVAAYLEYRRKKAVRSLRWRASSVSTFAKKLVVRLRAPSCLKSGYLGYTTSTGERVGGFIEYLPWSAIWQFVRGGDHDETWPNAKTGLDIPF